MFTFTTNLNWRIAPDEPEIEVEYEVLPAEARTRDYPGSPAGVSILDVVGVSRDLTADEIKRIFDDAAIMLELEEMAMERHSQGKEPNDDAWRDDGELRRGREAGVEAPEAVAGEKRPLVPAQVERRDAQLAGC